jgi:tRNA U34 2-thiouridine synthase MnmA/TrmU
MKVLVGISGGPRSLVTAWLLKKQGMQVKGVHFDLFSREGTRDRIHEIERKLGIQVQIVDESKSAGAIFLEERKNALLAGYRFSAKRTFQRKVLFPGLLRMTDPRDSGKFSTGHEVGLQDDPSAGVVRMMRGAGSKNEAIIAACGLHQGVLQRWIAPIGAIPETLLEKLSGEVVQGIATSGFEIDWRDLEAKFDSADPALLQRELQVFTPAGVLLGRAPLGTLHAGGPYSDPEDRGKPYRVIDLLPSSDRAIVQDAGEISLSEFHFDEGHWFTDLDPGMGYLDAEMMPESGGSTRGIRLIQFEGGRLKGLLAEPLRGTDANLFKGETVLFLHGAVVLGGARIIRAG